MDVDGPLNGMKLKWGLLIELGINVQKLLQAQSICQKISRQMCEFITRKKEEHLYGGINAIGKKFMYLLWNLLLSIFRTKRKAMKQKHHIEEKPGEEGSLHLCNLKDNTHLQSVLVDEDHFFSYLVKCMSIGNDDNANAKNENGHSQVNNQLINSQRGKSRWNR
ncbi:hypothetical protein Cgig2_027973 [Carnegiea gigantea]|uniref:Uncharacterized protein n=1 Tax=Carnegiea gigantea TaxID=171969 RepID=A0A9Q1JUU4_9CARY|nr:hypothetical protein Cgig2_027973 [Carnegiea gigantea]